MKRKQSENTDEEPERQKERQRGKKDYRVGLKIVACRQRTKQTEGREAITES